MENILNKTKKVGERIFYHPNPQLSYEYLSQYSLSSNTFRGFHRIDKTKPGAGQVFRNILNQQSRFIIKTINNATKENDIDLLSNELVKILKFKLSKNINQHQLQSYNKIRKPVDIVIEHMVSMFEGFEKVRQKIIPFLFLPLDSQMFQSEFVFSDFEIKELRLSRNFTFQDIWDKSQYLEIQKLLNEKARKLEIDRIFFDLAWNERYDSNGGNLFDTNPRKNGTPTKPTTEKTQQNKIMTKSTLSGEELSYSENQRKDAKHNKVIEKLNNLRNMLLKEPEFLKLSLSFVDESDSQDICIWLSGFSEKVKIQIKHQLNSEKIVINLRPKSNKKIDKEEFKYLMDSKGLIVHSENSKPYVPVQKIFTIPNYNKGILREYYQEIKTLLDSVITWTKA